MTIDSRLVRLEDLLKPGPCAVCRDHPALIVEFDDQPKRDLPSRCVGCKRDLPPPRRIIFTCRLDGPQ
jgi:hypothetical protein